MNRTILGPNEDFILQYHALKFEGDIRLEFKDFRSAILSYKRLKTFCDDRKRYKEKIVCYGQLGTLHALLEEHVTAIRYFHKMLELAWEQEEQSYEL
jgi:hypothetical protein